MKVLKALKEKSHARKVHEIYNQAKEVVRIADFDDGLYISFAGTPFVPIQREWTSTQIIEELHKLRQNFINSHINRINSF